MKKITLDTKLKDKIADTRISVTDRFLFFPRIAGKPKVEYLKYHWDFSDKNLLYVPIADYTERQVLENMYEALTSKPISYKSMSNELKSTLFRKLNDNTLYKDTRRRLQDY